MWSCENDSCLNNEVNECQDEGEDHKKVNTASEMRKKERLKKNYSTAHFNGE